MSPRSCAPDLNCLSFVVDVWTVAFSPDSQQIATGSHNGKISLFSVEEGTKTTTLDTGGKFVLSIACVSGWVWLGYKLSS